MQAVIELEKTRESLVKSMAMTIIVLAILSFFMLSDYQQTGELAGFGWLGIAALVAGVIAVAQQVYYFSREPQRLHLDLEQGQVINADNQQTLAAFDELTFFALSPNKMHALIECSKQGKMVMRLKRHYQLNLKVSDILTKYSKQDLVKLKFIGLTK